MLFLICIFLCKYWYWISGFVVFLGVIWVLQETTKIRILRYIILFIGKYSFVFQVPYCLVNFTIMLFLWWHKESRLTNCRCDEQLVFCIWYDFWNKLIISGYQSICLCRYWCLLCSFYADIYDDLISRRVHSSDAEKFAEVCPCPCSGSGWGIIW